MQILLQESTEGPHRIHVLSGWKDAVHGYWDYNKRLRPRTSNIMQEFVGSFQVLLPEEHSVHKRSTYNAIDASVVSN